VSFAIWKFAKQILFYKGVEDLNVSNYSSNLLNLKDHLNQKSTAVEQEKTLLPIYLGKPWILSTPLFFIVGLTLAGEGVPPTLPPNRWKAHIQKDMHLNSA